MTINFRPNERVSITLEDDGVAQVRLTRADKLNALDPAMFDALLDAGRALHEARQVRAVVLAGEGRAFCAGIDLGNFGKWQGDAAPNFTARTHGDANRFQHAALLWRKLPVPVIAAVHGVCFGGGLQLASGADIRILAPDARLSIMEMKWGLVPDMGGNVLWRGLVRDDVLRELTYTNREFSGEEASALGFATHVDADPVARASEIARTIAHRSPHAMRAAKALFNRLPDASAAEILIEESRAQHALKGSANQREAVASQMEKREVRFIDP
jgi:enoyl-CoA hydratase/carnithine racemase